MTKKQIIELIYEELEGLLNEVTTMPSPVLYEELINTITKYTPSVLVEEIDFAFKDAGVTSTYKKQFVDAVNRHFG